MPLSEGEEPKQPWVGFEELQELLRSIPGRPYEGRVFRWVAPQYPLPSDGPKHKNCATAGSYKGGSRMNAKGVQAPLYTSPKSWVAALEVTKYSPLTYQTLKEAVNASRDFLANERYQLFAIDVKLERVLDLVESDEHDLVTRFVGSEWNKKTTACQGLPTTAPSQVFGRAVFQAGFEAIRRPSIFLRDHWGVEHEVLDLFCPNLQSELRWQQVRP